MSRRDRRNQRPQFSVGNGLYEYVARGYDLTAQSYDAIEGRNRISERVRHATLAEALSTFHAGDRVLELGCGTGRDAVEMAHHGIRVVATDLSPEMVAITRDRVKRSGLENLVTVRAAPASVAAGEGGPYDGAYSNGAVLNLEPDIAQVASGLSRTIRSGGSAVFTAANRISFFEIAVYPLVMRPRKAFRKLGVSVPIPISREGIGKRYVVPTRFLTPREFRTQFDGAFDLVSLRALQAITPPWNLVDMASRFPLAMTALERIEDRFSDRPWLRSLGAIYLAVLRRRDA